MTNPEQESKNVNLSGFVTRSEHMLFVPLIFLCFHRDSAGGEFERGRRVLSQPNKVNVP